MSLNMIAPATVGAANIVSSSIADEPAYNAGTTYANEDRVTYNGFAWESLQAGNTGNTPAVGSEWWVKVGLPASLRPFDNKISNADEQAVNITYTLSLAGFNTGVALYNLIGTAAQVIYRDADDIERYNETETLRDNSGVYSWYSYFYKRRQQKTEVLFEDIPRYLGGELDIIITTANNVAAVGEIVPGMILPIGDALFGSSVGIQDFSRKVVDEGFGGIEVVERDYSDTIDFDVAISTPRVTFIKRELAKRRAKPTVYYTRGAAGLMSVIGFYSDLTIVVGNPVFSDCSLEIEGLV